MEKNNNVQEGKVVYRNHPIVMFKFVSVLAILLINFLFRNVKDILSNKDIFGKFEITTAVIISAVLLVISIVLIVRGFLVYKNSVIEIEEKCIRYKKYGIFFKTEKETLLTHITNVNLNSGIVYRLLGVKKAVIDINSSETADEYDYEIALSEKDAESFRNIIVQRKEIQLEKEKRIKNLIKSRESKEGSNEDKNEQTEYIKKDNDENKKSDCIEIKTQYDKSNLETEKTEIRGNDEKTSYFNVNFKRKFTKNEVIRSCIFDIGIANILEIIVVTILIIVFRKIFIIVLLLESLRSIFKSYNKINGFCVERKGKHIKIHYGLLDEKDFDIDVENIIGIGTNQTVLSKIMGYSCIMIDQIGYGNKEDELNWASLYIKDGEIGKYIKELIPEMSTEDVFSKTDDKKIKIKVKDSVVENINDSEKGENNKEKNENYIEKPVKTLYYTILKSIVIVNVLAVLVYMYFKATWIFVIAIIIATLIGMYIFYNKRILIKNDSIVFVEGIFSKDKKMIPYKKIESVNYKQSIIQKKMKVSTLEIYYRDYKNGKEVKSTGLYDEDTFDEILKYYKNGEQ